MDTINKGVLTSTADSKRREADNLEAEIRQLKEDLACCGTESLQRRISNLDDAIDAENARHVKTMAALTKQRYQLQSANSGELREQIELAQQKLATLRAETQATLGIRKQQSLIEQLQKLDPEALKKVLEQAKG